MRVNEDFGSKHYEAQHRLLNAPTTLVVTRRTWLRRAPGLDCPGDVSVIISAQQQSRKWILII